MADDVDGLIAALAALGTERNRAIYRRHGAREPIFGVSYKDVGVLAKRVGRDQRLADELWRSGHHDARVLTAQIADGSLIDRSTADRWIADVDEMNGALVAIGSRGGRFDDLAREVAARIGPVSVDHGLTGCKTPAAIPYLERIAARRSARG